MLDPEGTIAELRKLYSKTTRGLWAQGKSYGAIVSTDRTATPPDVSGADDWDGYGGYLIAESIGKANSAFIVEIHNVLPELLEYIEGLESPVGLITTGE